MHSSLCLEKTAHTSYPRICISPQCGFASHSDGNNIDDAAMRAKLQLVVKTAKAVWGDNI